MDKIIIMIIFDIVVLFALGVIVYNSIKKGTKSKVEALENEAKTMLENGKREAEATKKEAILEAKEEVHKLRTEVDKETRERRSEVQKLERRLIQREE